MAAGSAAAQRYGVDLMALLVVTIWGANFVFIKGALDEFDVLAFTFLRYAGMLVLGWGMILWLWLRRADGGARRGLRRSDGGARLSVRRADLPRMAVVGVLGFSLYMLLWAVGLSYTTAFSGALLLGTAPLFIVLLLWLLRLEAIGRWQWPAMVVAFAGVAVFVLGKGTGGATGAGDLISLASAFCYAAYTVANKPLVARYPALALTTYTLTAGAVPVLLLTLSSLLTQDWSRVSAAGWMALCWAIIVPVYFAWALWSWANARLGVARTSIYMYLVPIIGGVTAWLLLDEGFGMQKVLGASLVLAGLLLARRRAPVRPAEPRSLVSGAIQPRHVES